MLHDVIGNKISLFSDGVQTVLRGQEKGEITAQKSVNDIVRLYAMAERALLYDWCLCAGDYSLQAYASEVLPMFLSSLKNE